MHFQEQLASLHQLTNLSANAIPFQPQAALPTSKLVGAARGFQEQERDGAMADFSPPHGTKGFPLGRLPSPIHYQYHQSSDDGGLTTDESTSESISHKKRQRGRGSKGNKSGKSDNCLLYTSDAADE